MIINERARLIDGWMPVSELNWLAENAQKCKSIVEVGSYKGRSTRALLDNCSGRVYAIDPWDGPFYREDGSIEFMADDKLMHEFLENTKDCKNLVTFRGTLGEFVKTFDIIPVDMIFIDGCHLYEYVKKDIEDSFGILEVGGILSGHDYGQSSWPGVKRAVDECLGKVNLHDSIWWIKV